MMKMGELFISMDTTEASKEEKLALFREKVWEDFPAEIDSIMPNDEISEKFKDDPKKLNLAKKIEGFMYGGKSKGYVNTGMRVKFNSMKELNELLVLMQDNTADEEASGPLGGPSPEMDNEYSYSKRTLRRKTTIETGEEMTEEDMDGMKMMMGEGKVRTIVYLPKNVKSVKGEGIVEKTDKRVVFEYSMMDFMTGKVNPNFEIKLRKK